MTKKFKWSAQIWCAVYMNGAFGNSKDEYGFSFSHNSFREETGIYSTEEEFREEINRHLSTDRVNVEAGFHATEEHIHSITCRGSVRRVTSWEIADPDARPQKLRRKFYE